MAKAIDPVCGMEVDTDSEFTSEYNGDTLYFCSEEDKEEFDKHPARYYGKEGSDESEENETSSAAEETAKASGGKKPAKAGKW